MTTLTALNDTLSSAIKDKKLVLDEGVLDASLLAPFPNGSVPLDEVALASDGGALVLSGKITETWQPGGLSLALSSLSMSVTFTVNSNKVNAAFSFDAVMQTSKSSLAIKGSLSKDTFSFALVNAQNASISELLTDFADATVSASIPSLAVLNAVTLNTLAIDFSFAESKTKVNFDFGINKTWTLISKVLTVGNLAVNVELAFSKSNANNNAESSDGYDLYYSGALTGSVKAGIDYLVEVPFTSSSNVDIIITSTSSSKAAPTILDLASLIGGSTLRSSMKTALTAIKLSDIGIDKVQLSFDTVAKKLRYISADAHMVLAGVDASVQILMPGTRRRRLRPGQLILLLHRKKALQ